MVLTVEPLDSRRHLRSDFCCGKDSLDNYIRKQASQDAKKRVATIFVLIDHPEARVLAYYTLSAYTVNIAVLDQAFAKALPRYPLLPSVLLGRLAVDNRQQGKGLGELVLIDALKKSLDATRQIGALAVIAEALDQKAMDFYIKYGFQPFRQVPMKLYLPMKSIERMF